MNAQYKGGPSGPLLFLYICIMASVQTVYRTLKDLTNKEQKGFITPAVFNRFAYVAQLSIYNELFAELIEAKKAQRQNVDPGRDKSLRKRTLEDLAPFVTRNHNYSVTDANQSNVFLKPLNFSRLISISKGAGEEAGIFDLDRTNIELVYDIEKIDKILGSNLSTPTESFPVALITDEIEVFPSSIDSIDITYYRRPGGIDFNSNYVDDKPFYSTEEFDGLEVFSPEQSIDFMLPEHFTYEIVVEIAKMGGIRLRDGVVSQAALQESAKL